MSTESSQGIILDVLRKNVTPMQYKDLVEECKNRGLGHAVISRHLNKLEAAGMVVKEKIHIETGRGTQYRSTIQLPDLDPVEFREGWVKFIETSVKKTAEARDALSAFDTQINIPSPASPEFWLPYLKANEALGRTIHSAVAALGATIISILRDYSQQDDSVIAVQYLKVAADSSIPNLIRDIAKLTPPGSNFDYPAMQIAITGLFGKEAIEEQVEQMRKDVQAYAKSESEEK